MNRHDERDREVREYAVEKVDALTGGDLVTVAHILHQGALQNV